MAGWGGRGRYARNGFSILIDHEFRIVAVAHGFNDARSALTTVIYDAARGHRHDRAFGEGLHAVKVIFRTPAEIPVPLKHDEGTQLAVIMGPGRRSRCPIGDSD